MKALEFIADDAEIKDFTRLGSFNPNQSDLNISGLPMIKARDFVLGAAEVFPEILKYETAEGIVEYYDTKDELIKSMYFLLDIVMKSIKQPVSQHEQMIACGRRDNLYQILGLLGVKVHNSGCTNPNYL